MSSEPDTSGAPVTPELGTVEPPPAPTTPPPTTPPESSGGGGPMSRLQPALAFVQDPAHPEREVGAVFAGAFVLAQILRRIGR